MDCEKFDAHLMDVLYDELDELTAAAMKRHQEGCARCAGILAGLRATRDVGVLPMAEPTEELEARILEAVGVAQSRTPFRRKLLRGLAWAGSHAMRPQLAMAALFCLVIGSSLLLLRAKPGSVGSLPVRVTERGAPAPDELDGRALAQAMATASPAAAPAAQEVAAASRTRDDGARPSGPEAARAALLEARAVRDTAGCGAAVGKFDDVGARFPATSAAADAMWEEAGCYRALKDEAKARSLFLALRSIDAYRERADQALGPDPSNLNNAMAQRAVAAARPAAAAPAPPPAAVALAPAATPAAAAEATASATAPALVAAAAPAREASKTAAADASTAAPSATAAPGPGSAGKLNAAPAKRKAADAQVETGF